MPEGMHDTTGRYLGGETLFNAALAELPLQRNSSQYLVKRNLLNVVSVALLAADIDAPTKGTILLLLCVFSRLEGCGRISM